MMRLPNSWKNVINPIKEFVKSKANRYKLAVLADLLCLLLVVTYIVPVNLNGFSLLSPTPLKPLTQNKGEYEVFGFAPYWTFNKLDSVDFTTLTTLSYFGIEVNGNGDLIKDDLGYETFQSEKATELFRKAHSYGTRVVLTLTQMNNDSILALMDSKEAQNNVIDQAVQEVKSRGIDGINIDFEYVGNPGQEYRDKFSKFIKMLTQKTEREIPYSHVSVSVYASAVKDPKIYDIATLAKNNIKIFMMAYDFAVAGSDNAIPTAPLYGYQKGKYWYDIATAVKDFLTLMPANKLILGVPYYGYNYLVYNPEVKAETRPYYSWRGQPTAQTYALASNNIKPNMEGIDSYKTGWDPDGKVGWVAYHVTQTDTWRMIFLDDSRSLGLKYDFAKQQNLAGIGMWALGFDEGKTELWNLLREKFGAKLADNRVSQKIINANVY